MELGEERPEEGNVLAFEGYFNPFGAEHKLLAAMGTRPIKLLNDLLREFKFWFFV